MNVFLEKSMPEYNPSARLLGDIKLSQETIYNFKGYPTSWPLPMISPMKNQPAISAATNVFNQAS